MIEKVEALKKKDREAEAAGVSAIKAKKPARSQSSLASFATKPITSSSRTVKKSAPSTASAKRASASNESTESTESRSSKKKKLNQDGDAVFTPPRVKIRPFASTTIASTPITPTLSTDRTANAPIASTSTEAPTTVAREPDNRRRSSRLAAPPVSVIPPQTVLEDSIDSTRCKNPYCLYPAEMDAVDGSGRRCYL